VLHHYFKMAHLSQKTTTQSKPEETNETFSLYINTGLGSITAREISSNEMLLNKVVPTVSGPVQA
jgi:hypothetical protein